MKRQIIEKYITLLRRLRKYCNNRISLFLWVHSMRVIEWEYGTQKNKAW